MKGKPGLATGLTTLGALHPFIRAAVTETCVKRGSNRGKGPIRFLLLYRGSSPFTHCATSAGPCVTSAGYCATSAGFWKLAKLFRCTSRKFVWDLATLYIIHPLLPAVQHPSGHCTSTSCSLSSFNCTAHTVHCPVSSLQCSLTSLSCSQSSLSAAFTASTVLLAVQLHLLAVQPLLSRVPTEFRRHGIPSVFFTSVYSVFRAELAKIPRNSA